MEEVILVSPTGKPLGRMGKEEAHQKGILHLAFSIYIYNPDGQILLQKRAAQKYHSGGLWSNSCCSHPRPGELSQAAATRRLKEELGIFNHELSEVTRLLYRLPVNNNLIEHQLALVYLCVSDINPMINAADVEDYAWFSTEHILSLMKLDRRLFTPWFMHTFKKISTLLEAKFAALMPLNSA